MALPTLQPGLVPMANFEDMDVAAALLALQRGLAPAATAPIVLMTPIAAHGKSQRFSEDGDGADALRPASLWQI